jgi:hypothetical protein
MLCTLVVQSLSFDFTAIIIKTGETRWKKTAVYNGTKTTSSICCRELNSREL